MPSGRKLDGTPGSLDRFEPGGDLRPIDDKKKYEDRINALPAGEKELAQESARFADLCRYFQRQKMDVPAEIVEQLTGAAALPIPQRIDAMKKLNQKLLEHLPDVDHRTGIRQ